MSATAPTVLWIVGYPRSGNTWVTYLCSYILNLPFSDFDAPTKRPKQKWVDEAVSGGHTWKAPEKYCAVQRTHKFPHEVPLNDGSIIYIQRDPRDVFVSYSYYLEHVAPTLKGQIKRQMFGLLSRKQQLKWFINDWLRHFKAWHEHLDTIVNYEKLLAEGADYLLHNFRVIGLTPSPAIVNEALQKFQFENMTGGRTRGEEDQKSFFRRGVAGDWQNHLTSEESELLQQAMKEIMPETASLSYDRHHEPL